MRYETTLSRIANASVVVSIALVLILSLAMTSWTHPIADDFCRASVDDALVYVVDKYFNWTGRWAAMAIHTTILPNIDFNSHYPIIVALFWIILAQV
jgi:hypothetical protein